MSYDLVVFHAAAAPQDAAGFLDWYQQQAKAAPMEPRPALRAWSRDMRERGGPFDTHVTRDVVCANFAWDAAAEVFERAFELAGHHELGLFDPQQALRWLPNGHRGLFQWREDRGEQGSAADAVAVAAALLEALCDAGDLERDGDGDWEELTSEVAKALDRARHRSPIPQLWRLFLSHDAVGELYLSEQALKLQLDLASERVLGHPPSSDTGWV